MTVGGQRTCRCGPGPRSPTSTRSARGAWPAGEAPSGHPCPPREGSVEVERTVARTGTIPLSARPGATCRFATVARTREEYEDLVRGALFGVNLGSPSVSKFHRLDEVLGTVAGLPPNGVVSVTIRKAGNFSVRADQSPRSRGATILVGVCPDALVVKETKAKAREYVSNGRYRAVLLMNPVGGGAWDLHWGARERSFVDPAARLADAFGTVWEALDVVGGPVPMEHVIVPPTASSTMPSLIVDERTRRMLRTSVASRPAVMLVGPPGTGKSSLVEELLAEVAQDPARFGMSTPHEGLFVTPDESWTTRELVGGETVDDKGRIRFSIGAVLEAVSRDQWLVLDEANRADMDRIFGGLLTWLAGQTTTLGRVSGSAEAGSITLGWASDANSEIIGLEELKADDPSSPVEFLAGQEWRLIGTYNALDAHRVFRFGMALGRRFAHVPVLQPDPSAFEEALAAPLGAVPESSRDEVRRRVAGLYAAHAATPSAALGPAMFLGMPQYVAAGLELGGASIDELVAEAYLTSAGAWLSRLDDIALDGLGAVIADEETLAHQWGWVKSQLSALR